jgi:hypothetical protein
LHTREDISEIEVLASKRNLSGCFFLPHARQHMN